MKLFGLPNLTINEAKAAKWKAMSEGHGQTASFDYANFNLDPTPLALVLGDWDNPKTGTNVLGGLNLNYMTDVEIQAVRQALPKILKGKNLKQKYWIGRKLLPDIFKTYYRTYDRNYINAITPGELQYSKDDIKSKANIKKKIADIKHDAEIKQQQKDIKAQQDAKAQQHRQDIDAEKAIDLAAGEPADTTNIAKPDKPIHEPETQKHIAKKPTQEPIKQPNIRPNDNNLDWRQQQKLKVKQGADRMRANQVAQDLKKKAPEQIAEPPEPLTKEPTPKRIRPSRKAGRRQNDWYNELDDETSEGYRKSNDLGIIWESPAAYRHWHHPHTFMSNRALHDGKTGPLLGVYDITTNTLLIDYVNDHVEIISEAGWDYSHVIRLLRVGNKVVSLHDGLPKNLVSQTLHMIPESILKLIGSID